MSILQSFEQLVAMTLRDKLLKKLQGPGPLQAAQARLGEIGNYFVQL